jgi:ribose-phosphate pyrophosphokinase
MIKVNDTVIDIQHFSDGSQKLVGIHIPERLKGDKYTSLFEIVWKYENESELVTLIYIVNYIRDIYVRNNYITLQMLWVPNARMDRVESENDVFTLKYFSQIINSLKFNKVIVLDPHSRVTNALIDRVKVVPAEHFIQKAIKEITTKYTFEKDFNDYLVCFPDNGAFDRYSNLKCFDGFTKIFGKKHRDWETGKIVKLDLNVDEDVVRGKNVFIVDDMISSGETLYQFIQKLKSYGALQVYIYCSHLENRIMTEPENNLRQLLDAGGIRCIFTTDSLFNQTHPKIQILDSKL